MSVNSASKAIARRLHVVSSAPPSLIKGISNKQSQNRYVAAVLQDNSQSSSNIKTAQDIQLLLNNIGGVTRASMNQIEFLMKKASDKNSQHLTACEVIDLIARVRSV
mmetsp:Transcript_423/g.694  ORF Transcript_423/g.694 Transcript_423/m.694 type:complete len:107 (-) Transcript_423:1776-2096(-)|eukprot:scaffold135_cov160-Skeletonema_dohrnii-CCMP3373.AAC.3